MKLLEEGKKLTLKYNTIVSQYQSIIGQADMSINITMSLTRLNCFVSFWMDFAAEPRTFLLTNKSWHEFFSPTSRETIKGANQYNVDGEFQCQLHIGSKLYPAYPMRGHQDTILPITKKEHWVINHHRSTALFSNRMNINQNK